MEVGVSWSLYLPGGITSKKKQTCRFVPWIAWSVGLDHLSRSTNVRPYTRIYHWPPWRRHEPFVKTCSRGGCPPSHDCACVFLTAAGSLQRHLDTDNLRGYHIINLGSWKSYTQKSTPWAFCFGARHFTASLSRRLFPHQPPYVYPPNHHRRGQRPEKLVFQPPFS